MGIKIRANNWLEGANKRCNRVHVLRVAFLFHIGAVRNTTDRLCIYVRACDSKLIFIIITHSINSFSVFPLFPSFAWNCIRFIRSEPTLNSTLLAGLHLVHTFCCLFDEAIVSPCVKIYMPFAHMYVARLFFPVLSFCQFCLRQGRERRTLRKPKDKIQYIERDANQPHQPYRTKHTKCVHFSWHEMTWQLCFASSGRKKAVFKRHISRKEKTFEMYGTFDGSLIGWLVDCLVWWPLIFMRFQYCTHTLSNQLSRMRNVYYWHICRVVWNSLLLFLPFCSSFQFSSSTTLSFLPNPRPLQLSLHTILQRLRMWIDIVT